MKIGSLCTGYGGLDMAVESYFNAEMIWCAEIDKYASKLIEHRFNKPNLGDIKQIDWASVKPIDILTAGYPCQPFSTAGARKGENDKRHIWPYIFKAISVLRPKIVVLENVRGHLSLGFKEVLSDLAQSGYDAKWRIVRASDVGAPHQRARLFIIAYPKGGWSGCKSCGISESDARISCCCGFIANTNSERPQIQIERQVTGESKSASVGNYEITPYSNSDAREESRRADREIPTAGAGFQRGQNIGQTRRQHRFSREMEREAIPPTLVENKLNAKFVEYMMGLPEGWVTDLDLSRSQQLKMLGNGVVPQQAHYALELLCQ